MAWVAYGRATQTLSISIAITITEAYIAIAALMGIFINHEKVKKHQVIGIIVAITGLIILSIVVG